MKTRIFLLSISALTSLGAFGHGGGEAVIEVGPTKGVIEVTHDKSFKLSPEATRTLGVESLPFASKAVIVPRSALVSTLQESQVFRLRDGYIKAIPFSAASHGEQKVSIQSPELKSGDAVVVSGVGFLRIIAAQLGTAEAGDEHDAHDAHGSEGDAHHD